MGDVGVHLSGDSSSLGGCRDLGLLRGIALQLFGALLDVLPWTPSRADLANVVEPVEAALAQGRRVNELTLIARAANVFASDQFMPWFIKEQVEEVAR